MKKQPQSKFEKLSAGLKMLMIHQPAARMQADGGYFYIGDVEDPYLSRGAKDYLTGLGFSIAQGQFRFKVNDEG